MKSAKDILDYVDTFIARALDRPLMYAETPRSLEYMLGIFEGLREYIISDQLEVANPYYEYLRSFGGTGFCSVSNPTEGNEQTFRQHEEVAQRFVSFFTQYLLSQGRLCKRGEAEEQGHS